MKTWTIIRVTTNDGWYYDALEVEAALNPALDINFGGGDIIETGSYEIVLSDLDESEAMRFLDMSAGEREAVYILNRSRS